MDSGDDKTPIPKFNDATSDSFHLWQLRMRAVLHHKGVLPLVEGTAVSPGETATEEQKAAHEKLRAKAVAVLILGLGDRPLKAVQKDAGNPATLWKRLSSRYASKTTSTKLMLLNEVFTHKFSAGTALADHIADLELVFTKLSAAGHDLDELLQVSALLSSLEGVSDYEPTIAAIRTMDESKTTWEAVTSRLLDEANERGQTSSSGARLATTSATRGHNASRSVHFDAHPRVLGRGGGRGRGSTRRGGRGGRGCGRGQAPAGLNGQPRLTVARAEVTDDEQPVANTPTVNDGNDSQCSSDDMVQPRLTVLKCVEDDNSDNNTDKCTASVASSSTAAPSDVTPFLVDSGASHHVCCDKNMFATLEECDKKNISHGDKRELS